ncbi:hypothetical protein EE612_014687, partial [Oryza sativa]
TKTAFSTQSIVTPHLLHGPRNQLKTSNMEYIEVLKLRGLPYFTTAEDIIKFFVEYELTEENVHTAYRLDGKALYGVLNSRGCEDSHMQGQDDHWDKVHGAVPINPRGGQQDKITIHEPGNELFDPGIYFALALSSCVPV